MQKLLQTILTLLLTLASFSASTAQTVIWSDNFDAPSGGVNNNNAGVGWTLNSGGNGSNQWYIITPSSNIGCTSTGNQMHISCDDFLCEFFGNGPNDPIYNAAGSNNRSAVSPNISTVGQSNLSLSFEFVCNGVANQDYGLLAFSSDGGTNRVEFPERYEGVSSCSTKVISVPAQFLNIANFKIRFRWIESNAAAGLDPPFSIDNIRLTAPTSTCTPPTVSAGSNVSICSGQSTTIGGAPTATGGNPANYVYTWSPATGLSSTTIANPSANPTTTTTYTVSVNGGDVNCTATSTVTVTVNTPDPLSISPAGNQSICPGGSIQLTAANGFTNYSWTTPSGTISGQSVTATQAGNYTVTATDPDGCTSTSTVTQVSVTTVPALTISSSADLDLCPGENVTLSGTAGFTNYVWTTPSGTQNGNSISASAAGAYGLSATFGNCQATAAAVTIVIISAPSLTTSPTGSVTFCPGASVTLTGIPGFSNYSWNTPSGTVTNNSISATQAGSYTLSADYIGCTVTAAPIILNAISIPSLNINPTGPLNVCPGETPSLTATSGFTNYVWTTPSGNQSGNSIIAAANGDYSVSANFLGCTANSSVVTVATVLVPSLAINANGPISICPGGDVELSATTGFANYNWSTPSGNQTGSTINAQTAGNYTVSATFSGCAATSSPLSISSIATPALSTTPTGAISICTGTSETITAVSGFTNYIWSTPSGNVSGISVEANTAGNYLLSATFNGCVVQANPVTVSVNNTQTLAVTVDGELALCPAETVQLTAEPGFVNYLWSTGSTSNTITVSSAQTITVTADDPDGCDAVSQPIVVTALVPQTLSITSADNFEFCSGSSINLVATSGFSDYTWSVPNEVLSGAQIEASVSGIYVVTAIDVNGCSSISAAQTVIGILTPVLSISSAGGLSICPGQSLALSASSGFENYIWETPAGSVNGSTVEALQTGVYQVTADFEQCNVVSQPVSVNQTPPFQIAVTPAGPINLCGDETVTLVAESGFSNYQWSTSEFGQSLEVGLSGGYSVSATNAQGCSGTSGVIQVNQIDLPVADFTYEQNLDELYEINFTSTSQNATNYLWNFGSGNTSTEENPSFTFSFDNTWPVTLVVSNACGIDTFATGVIVIKTSLEDIGGLEVNIIQLPDGSLQIKGNLDEAQALSLDILAVNGQLIWHSNSPKSNSLDIQVPAFDVSEGLYFVRIQSGEKARVLRYFRQ